MNKGLFFHLISTIIIIAAWKFVIWDEDVTKILRIRLVGGLFAMNTLIFIIASIEDFYNEKIKLW
jgi:hypothetical protein